MMGDRENVVHRIKHIFSFKQLHDDIHAVSPKAASMRLKNQSLSDGGINALQTLFYGRVKRLRAKTGQLE